MLPPNAIPMAPAVKSMLEYPTAELLRNPAVVDILLATTDREFNIAFDIDGHPYKCRVDGTTSEFFYDFKTTRDFDPSPTFQYECRGLKYDLQAAFYMVGGLQVGWPRHQMRFIATSTTYPHHNCVMTPPKEVIREAEQRVYALLKELEQRMRL